MAKTTLLFPIRNQIYKDSTPERILMFQRLIESKRWLKAYIQILELKAFRRIAVLTSLFYGLFSRFLIEDKNSTSFFIGHRNNEKKIFERYKTTKLSGYSFVAVTPDTHIDFPSFNNFFRLVRYYQFLSNLSKHEKNFFVLMRVSRLLFYYSSLLDIVRNKDLRLAFSTDGNPYGNAVMAFYKNKKIKTLFLAHAADSIQPLRLCVDTAYFYGEHSSKNALANGSQIREVRFFSFDFPKFEKSEIRNVGIFLAKDFIGNAVKNLVEDLIGVGYSSVLIRLHPDSILKLNAVFSDERIQLSQTNSSVEQDISRCQIVIGGNSTVLLDSLLQGVLSFYDKNLDAYSEFILPTISNGVVQSISGVSSLEIEKLRPVYLSKEWKDKLANVYNFVVD